MDDHGAAELGLVAACMARAARWGVAGLSTLVVLLAAAGFAQAQESSDTDAAPSRPNGTEKSPHDYTVSVRAAAWITWVDGEVEDTSGRAGNVDTVDIDDDLGFDDPTTQFVGTGNLRMGKHDFWIIGFHYDESEDETVGFNLDFGQISVPVSRRVITDLEFTDVNFRYGYSPFTFEEDGFRLGPTISVSYSSVFIELEDKDTGKSEKIDETYPAPTVGLYGGLPIGDVVLEASMAGVYIDAGSDFEGWALRAGANAVWRPWDHVGVFAGINWIYVDLELTNEDIQASLYGPMMGVELRF